MKGPKTDPCGIPQNRKQYGANGANSVKSNSSFNWIKYINFKLAYWYIISTENANKQRKINMYSNFANLSLKKKKQQFIRLHSGI